MDTGPVLGACRWRRRGSSRKILRCRWCPRRRSGGLLAAWASLGAALFKSGSGIHFVMVLLYGVNGYLARTSTKDFEEARGSTQPATDLLQSTLNPSEKRFFDAFQTTPPTRATLTDTGRVAAGTIVLSVGCAVLGRSSSAGSRAWLPTRRDRRVREVPHPRASPAVQSSCSTPHHDVVVAPLEPHANPRPLDQLVRLAVPGDGDRGVSVGERLGPRILTSVAQTITMRPMAARGITPDNDRCLSCAANLPMSLIPRGVGHRRDCGARLRRRPNSSLATCGGRRVHQDGCMRPSGPGREGTPTPSALANPTRSEPCGSGAKNRVLDGADRVPTARQVGSLGPSPGSRGLE